MNVHIICVAAIIEYAHNLAMTVVQAAAMHVEGAGRQHKDETKRHEAEPKHHDLNSLEDVGTCEEVYLCAFALGQQTPRRKLVGNEVCPQRSRGTCRPVERLRADVGTSRGCHAASG